MSDFKMPALGADMEAGTLVEWLVKAGDRVKSGDIIAVVETQKGAIEVEIFQEGVVSDIIVNEGERVPVGTVLAHIEGAAGEPPPTPTVAVSAPTPKFEERESAAVSFRGDALASRTPSARITPAARKHAATLGVDLTSVRGTGVEGSIRLADVQAAAAKAEAAPPSPVRRGVDLTEMRKAIAAAMSRSKREIPHYYLTETVDLGIASSWIEHFNADKTPAERILPAVLFLKAVALALVEWPQLNGAYENGAFAAAVNVHVGWAIALRGGGLIAPAIRDTNKKSPIELMAAMRDLVERARRGNLRSSELTSPTATVTNVGDRGPETVTGVIYPPQVAIVGFGRVVTRPWAVEGRVEIHPVVTVSLAADHRVTDGHIGGLFLNTIARSLQEPEKL